MAPPTRGATPGPPAVRDQAPVGPEAQVKTVDEHWSPRTLIPSPLSVYQDTSNLPGPLGAMSPIIREPGLATHWRRAPAARDRTWPLGHSGPRMGPFRDPEEEATVRARRSDRSTHLRGIFAARCFSVRLLPPTGEGYASTSGGCICPTGGALATACWIASPWRSLAMIRPSGPMRKTAAG